MKRSEKEALDLHDLLLLRNAYRPENDKETDYGKDLPICNYDKYDSQDIWSRALRALSQDKKDEEVLRKLYGEIMSMTLPVEVLKWWETLFAVTLHAPIEELGRITAEDQNIPENINISCIAAAAAAIAEKAMAEEQERRRKIEEEERKYLRELQWQAEKAAISKQQAEKNLETHRHSRGNRA